ncbi:MAG: hypothetical protein HYX72_10695 [Acidobacteria bacterium]|nr:hypothetical protein [Acidobacteriota bacterium]
MTRPLYKSARPIALALCLLVAAAWGVRLEVQPKTSFAQLVKELSEPGGFFDTDNLISNEQSYLHVIPALEQGGVRGGVYIGVGPDQNFSYVAHIRPKTAFIVDIRRDNLLLQLLLKALFKLSRNRAEYLALLTGRPVPDNVNAWRDASIERIVAYIDETKAAPLHALDLRLHDTIATFGVPLSSEDIATIDRFHATFARAGLSLRFQTFGRTGQMYYPNYRELILETDRQGRKLSYLISEDDFQFVRSLEAADQIVPVVGDLGGTHAVAAIAQWMTENKQHLSAFYVSNVENYLFRNGGFERYMQNLDRIPHNKRSVVIRSIFGRAAVGEAVPGYYSASTVQNFDELLAAYVAGRYRSYSDLLRKP